MSVLRHSDLNPARRYEVVRTARGMVGGGTVMKKFTGEDARERAMRYAMSMERMAKKYSYAVRRGGV